MENDLKRLHQLATKCRDCQRAYFKDRTRWALEASKAVERELDALLTEIAPRLAAVREQEHAVGPSRTVEGSLADPLPPREHDRGSVEFRRDQ
jgi:hypothetical protein